MEESELNNIEIFNKEFIKKIDVDKVTDGFEKVKSFNELKTNKVFRNLFKNIAEDINIEREIANFGDDFLSDFSRDIYLITKWYESLESQGKTIEQFEDKIDKLAVFYISLQKNVGGSFCDLDNADREVFERWIIKSNVGTRKIKQIWKTIDEFYKFLLTLKIDIKDTIFNEEEMKDLQRVADELKKQVWEEKNEEYTDWREKNILCYM